MRFGVQLFRLACARRVEGFFSFRSLTLCALLLSLLALAPIGLTPNGSAAVVAREVLSLRSARSETFITSDGEYRTRLYARPINYLSASGAWQPIDDSLVPSKNPGFTFQNAANSFHVYFKDSLDKGFMRFDAPDGKANVTVALEKADSANTAQTLDSALSYTDVRPQTDIQYDVVGDGLKETLVLHDSSAPSSYVFDLTPADGQNLSAVQQADGSIDFYARGDSEPAFSIAAPTVSDSNSDGSQNPPAPGKASMTIDRSSDGSFRLTVEIDTSWLSDPKRVFPVYLDPNYNAATVAQDGYYSESNGGLPNTTSTSLLVGRDPSIYGAAVTYDLATIPVGAQVTGVDAVFNLSSCIPDASCSGKTGTLQMRRFTNSWTNTPWASVSVDSTILTSLALSSPSSALYTLPETAALRSTIQSMVNGTVPNFGFLIESGGTVNGGFKFCSSRGGNPSNCYHGPYLDVYWQNPGVTLNPAPPLHANGADLSWSRWSPQSTYVGGVSADGPLHYWRMDDSSSGSMKDYMGTLQGLYYPSNATPVAGALANDPDTAASFNGSQNVVVNSPVQFGSSDFSIEGWFKTASTATESVIFRTGRQDGADSSSALVEVAQGVSSSRPLFFNVQDGPGNSVWLSSPSSVNNGAWHYFAATRSGSTFTLYLDGAKVDQTTATMGSLDLNTTPYQVTTIASGKASGSWVFNKYFTGSLDEIATYSQALPLATVQAHYALAPNPMPTFQRYEIHRSTSPGFTPSASTLIGTITDPSILTFRDSTAKPSTTFYYKVVSVTSAGSLRSNEVRGDLPGQAADGSWLSTVTIQPGLGNGSGSYASIDSSGSLTWDENEWVVARSTTRSLLDFDLRSIPSYVTIDSAQLKMYTYQPAGGATIDVNRVAANWNRNATWQSEGSGMSSWTTAGGDFDPAAAASVTENSPLAHWDSWDITGLVQNWDGGAQAQNGLIVKHHTESGAPAIYWIGAGSSYSIALRPKLVVTYEDPSAAPISPQAAISSPAPSAQVKGTAVVTGGASDDGKVVSVQFKLDGSNLGSALTAPPYQVSWNTTTASRGQHTLTMVATDNAGNTTTSSPVAVTVANSNAPTVSITAAAPEASPDTNVWDVTASASDDIGVDHVDFLVDGKRFATDTSAPWTATLNTLTFPVYDGVHQITARAFDQDGNFTTSTAQQITVSNTAQTMYQGTISTSGIPTEMRYDPNAQTQAGAPVTVALQNTSLVTWTAANVTLRYRWLNPDGTVFSTSGDVQLGSDIAAGTGANVPLTIQPPALPASVMRGRFTLRIDLYDGANSAYFAGQGNQPFEQTVTVTRVQPDTLGLERYQQYDGTDLGSGVGASVNLYNGNLVVNTTLSKEPGIGLDTVVGLTYNSLENGSVSPVGNNWSLAISGLIPFGLPLDIHPNAADTAAGRTGKWIGFTDADGSYHRFTIDPSNNFYDAPAGVHLYLRQTTSPSGFALTKPDRTTFYFNSAGYPTSVADKDGNTITFTETPVPAGNDINGLTEQITAVTDQGGRSYNISYYDKTSTSRPELWGKVSQISDHIGHRWVFAYYDDGNLMSVTEQGGANADGSYLPDRSVIFDYTTPDGSGPAIATLAGRKSPDPTVSESTRLYSVIDCRGNETSFAYFTSGAKQWRVSRITNRNNVVSSTYDYVPDAGTVTVSMPLSRVWTYGFDAKGRPTSIVDPLDETKSEHWTDDNELDLVTEPTGRTLRYAYNANGMQTDSWDEAGDHTTWVYENLPVDGNDPNNPSQGVIPHLSRLISTTTPDGNTSPTSDPSNSIDYTTTNHYSDSTHDRVDWVEDAYGNKTTYTYNANGTLASMTLPNAGDGITRTTTYNSYDANGLATKVTDAAGNVTQSGYDAAGRQLWSQDANHQNYTGGDPTQYRSYSYYDSFGRVGRTSSPKSSSLYPGVLIWNDTTYDANDNALRTYNAHYGMGDGGVAAYSSTQYNPLDFPTVVTSARTMPDGSPIQTQTVYDDAGRAIRQIKAKGMGQTHVAETDTSYDLLDRVYQTTDWGDGVGRTTTSCYDLAGDLRSTTAPNGSPIGMDCPAIVAPDSYTYISASYTSKTEYDAAHRQIKQIAADGTSTETGYDANGQTVSSTDAEGKTTTTTYDDKGEAIKTVTPFEDGHPLTTVTEYNAIGWVTKDVSAQAYDYANGAPPYTKFVTTYSYDALGHKVKTSLPYGSTDAYKKAVLSDAPSQYWRLGEASGTTAANQVSGGATGTYVGSPTLGVAGATTDADTAATFNGSSQYMTTAPSGSLAGSFTIEVWAKPQNATAVSTIVGTRGPSDFGFDMKLMGGNKIHGDIGNGTSWITAAADASFNYQANTWYQIAYVVTPTGYTIYANGWQVGSGLFSGTPLLYDSTHKVYVGQSGAPSCPEYFNGTIDEVAIYPSALSASSIKAHYDSAVPHYTYQSYDANGSQTMVSQQTSATSVGGVAAADKTTTSYLDTGAIYSTLDGSRGLSIRYDYTPEGWQSARWPDGTGTPGIIDYTRSMYTDYFPDGLESAARDLNGQRELFAYDQDGNQTLAIEAAGIEQASQSPIWIDRTYDDFDTLTKTRVPEPGVSGRYLATLYTYDSDGNQTSEAINQEEDASGNETTPARLITDSYDLTDVLTSQTDDQGTPGDSSDDTELTDTYTPDDELSSSTLLDANGTQDEETDYGYYADGELASQSSQGAQGQTLQTDSVSYVSPSGVYMNGNQVSENYSQHGPSQTVSGTASWGYNADGQLTSENPGTAQGAASYALDATGDITSQQSASGTTTDTYANEQLTSQTTSGTTTRYLYDAFGNVNCAVTSSWTLGTCPAPGDTHLVELYTYDYKNRETSDVIYNSSGVVTDSVTYTYDALDRIVIKTEYHSGSWTTTCTVYEGDSTTVASEKVYPYASPTGNPSDLKTYAYDGSGNIVSLTDRSGGNANRYSLVANPQNSVSLLLDASGNVKQSYGYSAYGQANSALTQLGTLSSTLDPYRFQEKRLDPAFNSYDMGARRYSLTTDRWQQQDMYYDASQDLGLAGDPTTSDKYEFLGGNPVNYVEADGHCPMAQAVGKCEPGWKYPGPSQQQSQLSAAEIRNKVVAYTIWASNHLSSIVYEYGGPRNPGEPGIGHYITPLVFPHTDCSGFVTLIYMWASHGNIRYDPNGKANDYRGDPWFAANSLWIETSSTARTVRSSQVRAGDLVTYGSHHVAIFLDNWKGSSTRLVSHGGPNNGDTARIISISGENNYQLGHNSQRPTYRTLF